MVLSHRSGAIIPAANVALTMTPSGPHDLKISGTVPVKVDDIPVDIVTVINTSCTADVGVGSNASCNGNTPVVSYVDVPIAVGVVSVISYLLVAVVYAAAL